MFSGVFISGWFCWCSLFSSYLFGVCLLRLVLSAFFPSYLTFIGLASIYLSFDYDLNLLVIYLLQLNPRPKSNLTIYNQGYSFLVINQFQ